jgi:hypothetical protein
VVTLKANDAPIKVVSLNNPDVIKPNTPWVYVIPDIFSDPNGNPITFRVDMGNEGVSSWLKFNEERRELSGTPPKAGEWTIDIIGDDGCGGEAHHPLTIRANTTPQLVNKLMLHTVAKPGVLFEYTIPSHAFSDPDGHNLTYHVTNLPDWLHFNKTERRLYGTPPSNGVWDISVRANDGYGGSAIDTLRITVSNKPTVLNPLVDPPTTLTHTILRYTVPATTFAFPGTPSVTYRATCNGATLPEWLGFNDAALTFTAVPPKSGEWKIRIIATDTNGNELSASVTFRSNTLPEVNHIMEPRYFFPNTLMKYKIPTTTFKDADGHSLNYRAKYNGGGLPPWLSFRPDTQLFIGVAPTVGTWPVVVTVSDGNGGEVSNTVTFKCVVSMPTLFSTTLKEALESRKNYVSGEDWKSYFGCSETYPEVPANINTILLGDCPFSSNGKKVYETHMLYLMPKTCSGTPVTIQNQRELWSSHTGTMPNSKDAKLRLHGSYSTKIKTDSFSNGSVGSDEWVLMYVGDPGVENGVIPGSRYKTWSEQQTLFNSVNDGNYEIVDGLDVVTGVMMKYIKTGEKILTSGQPNQPNTRTRTVDHWSDRRRVVVGHFSGRSLYVGYDDANDSYDSSGLGLVRKFR